jgi:tritrans,polycis-undecaprenyl-diphosphate synthase [geranylgeranyl-diphosphate specific]
VAVPPNRSPPTPAADPSLSHALAGALREAQERAVLERIRSAPVPRHLAIIMDGNRRFAAGHGMLVSEGHVSGRDNLDRPPEELQALMDLFANGFRDIVTDPRVHRHHIRVRAIGNVRLLRADVQQAIADAEAATKDYTDYQYNVAIAYGGREEIVLAIRSIAEEVAAGRVRPGEIDATMVSKRLYTADLPDPDLVFRTSGEERISNFLLWQTAYAELYFADVLWPGLTKLDFLKAIQAFQNRMRRFGR